MQVRQTVEERVEREELIELAKEIGRLQGVVAKLETDVRRMKGRLES